MMETPPPRAIRAGVEALARLATAFAPWAHGIWFGLFALALGLAAWGGLGAVDPIAHRLGDDDYSHWLAFGALGAFAAAYPSWIGRAAAFAGVCALALGLEVAQHFLSAARGASIDDLANSLIGAGAGFSAVYAGLVLPVLRVARL